MGRERDIAYGVGAAVSSPVWGWSLLRTGKWRSDWRGRFGRGDALDDEDARPRVLIHAVSVGEVNATRTLVAWLREHRPDVLPVVSATTNTGHARAVSLYADAGVPVVRYPLDFSGAVAKFLDRVRPSVVALMELEVWPNFVEACVARGVPVGVVNGRLSERSFANYRKVRGLVRPTFARLAFAGVQSEAYLKRFVGLGVRGERVSVMDTMKWDTATLTDGSAAAVPGAVALAASMGIDRARPVIVAGSTAPGEDALLADGLAGWPAGTQLVLVPRKPEWFDAAAAAAERAVGTRVVRRTAHRDGVRPIDGTRVFLLDTIGELRAAYALADVAVVGRSFTGELYGSDLTEPIALGRATVIGPYHGDFRESVDAFVAGGGTVVSDRPGDVVQALLTDPARRESLGRAGQAVIRSRQGATERYGKLISGHLR